MKQFVSAWAEAFDYDGPILAGKALVWAVLLFLLAMKGVDGLEYRAWSENLVLYSLVLAVITVIVALRALYRARPASPIRFLMAEATGPAVIASVARGIPMVATMVVWMPIFSAAKSAIPLFNSYSWDATLMAADRAIFGTDAWRVLQPLLGHPLVTSALSVCYHVWIALIYVAGIYFAFFVTDRRLRAQYLVARFAVWTVLGVIIATAFASLGPCFVGPVLGEHRFDQQMAYLHAANEHYRVFVLPVQEQLLEKYRQNDHGLGGGISAMPSMHIAVTLLSALAAWRVSRVAGACLYLFLGLIALGSVHLGYHYAVDGMVSACMVLVIWKTAGAVADLVIARGDALRAAKGGLPDPALALA